MRKRGTGCGRQSRLTGRSGHRWRSGQGPGGHPCSPSPAIVSLSGRPWVCPQGRPAMPSVPSPHASGDWQALASGPRFLGKRVRSHRLLGAAGPRVWSAGHPASPPRRDARRARRPGKGHRIPGVGFTSAVPRALRPALADVRHPAWVPLGDCQDPGPSAASPGAVGTRGRLARPSGSHGSGGPR